MNKNIIIGTRGSKLALFQANKVKDELSRINPGINFEVRIIKTKGDKILDVALSKIGDKGLFTKELETALIENEVDVAVHSLKDLPTDLPDGLCLGGVLRRDEFQDALVSVSGKKLSELDENDIIATSSLRRKAQLLKINPDFNIVDIRGNVDSRIHKMKDGYCTALVMSAAGLIRLGFNNLISEILDPEIFIPAVSQGVIAMEIRKNDDHTLNIINAVNDMSTLISSSAERVFLKALNGGCQVPAGCYTKIRTDKITISGFISCPDGSSFIKDSMTGLITDANKIANDLADSFYARGAGKILIKCH